MSAAAFIAARDFLIESRTDYERAYREFRWPELDRFNWALDYFDPMARGNNGTALWIVNEGGGEQKLSFAEIVGTLEPPRQLPARARRQARRPGAADARQCRAAVGIDAGGDETRRGRDPGDDALDPRRSDRPLRARPRPPRNHQRRQHREIRRNPRRLHAHRGWRHPAIAEFGMAPLRGRVRGSGRVRAGRRDARHRPAAAVFHLRHDGAAEAGSAQPSELPGRPSGDDVLDRPRTRRYPSEHLVAGLGEARL